MAYRAVRVYYVARSHAALRRWKEAAVLFTSCEDYIKQIKERNFSAELLQLLNNVEETVEVEVASTKANYILEQTQEVAAPVPQKVRGLFSQRIK